MGAEDESDLNGLVRVVLKLAGLALAMFGAVMLSNALAMSVSKSDMIPMLAVLSQPLLFILAGLFLWFFPAPVANTVVRRTSSSEDLPRWADRIVEAGMVLIGIWWLLSAISDLVYHVSEYRAQEELLRYTGGYEGFGPLMIATVAELVLALVLIIGARGIVGLIHWFRHGGMGTEKSGD